MKRTITYNGKFTKVQRTRPNGEPFRNGFCWARFQDEATGDNVSVKGRIPSYVQTCKPFTIQVTEGDTWKGTQQYWFVSAKLTERAQDPRRTLNMLLQTISGIGPVKAHQLLTALDTACGNQSLVELLSHYAQRYDAVKGDPQNWATAFQTDMAPLRCLGIKLAEKVLVAWQEDRGMHHIFGFTHWLKQIGLPEKDIDKLMTKIDKRCRQSKSRAKLHDVCRTLQRHPYMLVASFQVDFAFLDWRLYMIDGKYGVKFDAVSPERFVACIIALLTLALDDHMMVPCNVIAKRVATQLNKHGHVDAQPVTQFILEGYNQWRPNSPVDATALPTLVFVKAHQTLYVTTKRRWMIEADTYRYLRKCGMRTKFDTVSETKLSQNLYEHIVDTFKKHVNPQASPTDNQVSAIQHMFTAPFTLLQGYPGVGKSTVVGVLCQMLLPSQHIKDRTITHTHVDEYTHVESMDIEQLNTNEYTPHNVEIHLLAPTGMAARRLGEAAGNVNLGKTVHMAIHSLESEADRPEDKDPTFPVGLDATYVVIDEMSMVNSLIFQLFLKQLDNVAQRHNLYSTRNLHLILVGDSKQLPPIGAGLPFTNLLQRAHPSLMHTLTCVHRTANDPTQHLSTLAERLRTLPYGDTVNTNTQVWFKDIPTDSPAFRFTDLSTQYGDAITLVVDYVKKKHYTSSDLQFQVICPRTVEAVQWNMVLKDVMNPYVRVNSGIVFAPKYRKETIQRGDRVIFVKNHYEKNLRNGCVGVVQLVREQEYHTFITVRFPDLEPNEKYTDVVLSTRDTISGRSAGPSLKDNEDDNVSNAVTELSQLHLAYAISVHKSQGGQYDDLILYTGPGSAGNARFYNRPLLYTGFTRGKKQVQVIGPSAKLSAMLRRPLPPRITILSLWLAYPQGATFISPSTQVF